MKVLLFGSLAEAAGTPVIEVECATNTQSLQQAVLQKYPALRNRVFKISVNRTIADQGIPLHEADEVALLPPYAGG